MSLKHIIRDSFPDDIRKCIVTIDSLAKELELRLIRSEKSKNHHNPNSRYMIECRL